MEGFGGLAGAALGWGEFVGEDGEELFPKNWDVFYRGIPKDLPVQVEIGVDDAMANGDDLSPRDFRVTVSEGE